MKRHLITPLLKLSGIFEWLAKHCGYQPPVPPPLQVRVSILEMLSLGKAGLLGKTENEINDALRDRPRTKRDQIKDNKLLAPLSWAINESIRQGNFRLASEVFRENYARILA